MDNYPIFSELNWYSDLKSNFYFMWSCSAHHKFRDLCKYFWIIHYFILDIDVISKNSQAKWWFLLDIKNKILELNIECSKKRPEDLLDENLNSEQKILKSEIINNLKEENYFILSKWAFEQYFTWSWEILDWVKKNEIITFLDIIKNN